MQADGMRIIHIEPYRMSPPDGNYIYPDYKRAGYLATMRLLLAGYTSLVFAGAESDWPSARLFRHGFIEALDDQCGGYDPQRHYYEFPTYADRSPERHAALEAFLNTVLRRPASSAARTTWPWRSMRRSRAWAVLSRMITG